MSDESNWAPSWINKISVLRLKTTHKIFINYPCILRKLSMRCAISSRVIVDSYFFEDGSWIAVTMDEERYLEILTRSFLLRFEEYETHGQTLFQQDGNATCHTARVFMDFWGSSLRDVWASDMAIFYSYLVYLIGQHIISFNKSVLFAEDLNDPCSFGCSHFGNVWSFRPFGCTVRCINIGVC